MSEPQPPLDEHGEAREALTSAVASFGPRILHSPQMLRNVVTDLLPDMRREQNLLIAAAEADVASDLNQRVRDQNITAGTAVQLAARALADKKAIDPAASMWVTTEYAKAMGYDVPAYVSQPTPSPGLSTVPPPPSSQPIQAPQQSVPPWSVPPPQSTSQPLPQYAQQSVPPVGGYGGAPSEPWGYGPSVPGGPPMPPNRGNKNHSVLIAAISAAAVVIIAVVAIVVLHGHSGPPNPTPSPTLPSTPVQTSSSPSPSPSVSTPSNQEVASYVASVAVGNIGPGALQWDPHGTATQATCDPRTVSNPPDPGTPTTASCDITYSDGTIWQQTVTVTYDSANNPISVSANNGTQING